MKESLILALEQSTAVGSAALLRGPTVLAFRSWEESSARNQRLFAVLPELFREAGCEANEIALYAVGLGPGSFSGVRIALSTARGMALPGGSPVVGISSAEALAWQIWTKTRVGAVAVVGDARRERLWLAAFGEENGRLAPRGEIRLVAWDELRSAIATGTLLVTPDWARIGERLEPLTEHGAKLERGGGAPHADSLGRLAVQKLAERTPLPPLRPIYLHPGVSAPPRRP